LALIGYTPIFSLHQTEQNHQKSKVERKLLHRIGLAGFVFANIIMLSFLEYLAISNSDVSPSLLHVFNTSVCFKLAFAFI